jgi:hypothetical protein
MRVCKECKLEKETSEYYINEKGWYISSLCKNCHNKRRRKNYEENKESFKEKRDEYIDNNKDKINQRRRLYYNKNKDVINEKRKEQSKKAALNYYYKNKKTQNKKTTERRIKKLKSDPFYKLIHNIRCLVRKSLQNQFTTKSKKTIEILGCSFEEFKLHLESQFDENMNWKNQGTYWHMDHIIPISSAQTEEDVYRLNHYTNFQPLYWEDNLKKSNKINEE